MPRMQSANIGIFDFGAPTAEAAVLEFRKKAGQGGRLILTFESPEDATADMIVTVQTGVSQAAYVDTSVARTLVAIANITVVRKGSRTFEMLLRPQDEFFRVQASGGTRGLLQLRGDEKMDIVLI